MIPSPDLPATTAFEATPGGIEPSIPQLVAAVYDGAPAVERGHLLAQLMRPLGVLSLFGIAGGIFANIRFRSGWPDLQLRGEDISRVRSAHVVALAEHAQQVSVEAVDGLAQWLAASPVLSGSAAAAMLAAALLRRARARHQASTPGPASTLPFRS